MVSSLESPVLLGPGDTTIGRKFQVAGDDHQPEAGEKSCGTWETGGGNWAIRFEVNI